MTFSARITRAPIPFEPARGADACARLGLTSGALADLIAGAAGCSPYLNDLMQSEADWLPGALAARPEDVLADLLGAITRLEGVNEVAIGLRRAKRRVALLAALADLGGVWPLEQVTAALTDLADAAVQRAMITLVAAEITRGKIPGAGPDDIADGAGMVAFAMGKMGAHELNYSSDIDLICLFDEARYDPADFLDARAAFIRVARKLANMLSERTAEGYVFRTDLRLRPDPSVTPVCISMLAAERYYESVGRTWERAAWIKARPCAGDLAAGARFLQELAPFVWRRHLDFAAIQDAHDMRLKIRDHKRLGGPIVLEGHNMKLGQGGIREIEFFTQTRQLIAGGRDPDLRARDTVAGLAALAAKGWVAPADATTLTADYRAHREVEHRLQMIADAQTHSLPTGDEGFARLAAFMGTDADALRRDLYQRLSRVARLTEGFFAPGTPGQPTPELSDAAREITGRWAHYPALRSTRAVQIFNRLRPDLLARLQRLDRPDEALIHFDGFLAGLPAGVQLFSLFEANPQLVDLVIDICSTAPHLARYLSRNSAVFDAVIGGDFFAPWPGVASLQSMLAAILADAPDYESRLDAARRWAKEWHFRVGVHQLRGLIDADTAGREYADLAQAVVAAIWPHVVAEFGRKHGPPPGRGAMVLGMGSLGAGRLNAASDLDLIVIYDAAGEAASEGRRPLASRAYYARLTQAFVTALSAPMAEGKLYDVDMRLRPSGRQGPVATSIDAFRSYQMSEAWTWEHLALTRARPVAGDAGLCDEIAAFRRELLAMPRDQVKLRADTADMRTRLADAKPATALWEARNGPGRLMDIELIAQAAALLAAEPSQNVLDQLAAGGRLGWFTGDEVTLLIRAYRLFWSLRSAARLLSGDDIDPDRIGQRGMAYLLRATGARDEADLAAALSQTADAADAVITALLARQVPRLQAAP